MTGPTSEGSVNKKMVDEIYTGPAEAVAIATQFEGERTIAGNNVRMAIEIGREEKEISTPTGKVNLPDNQFRAIAKKRIESLTRSKKEIERLLETEKDDLKREWLTTMHKKVERDLDRISKQLNKVEDKDEMSK